MRLENILYAKRHAPDEFVGLRLPIRIPGGPPRMQQLRDQGFRRSEAAALLEVPYTSFLFNEHKYAKLDLVEPFLDGHRHRSISPHPHSHVGKVRLGIEDLLRRMVKDDPGQKVNLKDIAREYKVSGKFVSKVYNNMKDFEVVPPLKFAVPQREGTVDSRREKVMELRSQGKSLKEVCVETGLSLGYVKGIVRGRYEFRR